MINTAVLIYLVGINELPAAYIVFTVITIIFDILIAERIGK